MAFDEVRFPVNIALGATGGPAFKTEIVTTAAGLEYRNALWSVARGTWDVGSGVKGTSDYQAIIAFHYARQGSLRGFRFKDWSDYSVTDQTLIASADGGETTAQLVKTYTNGGRTYTRTIYKPVSGTVTAKKNGDALSISVNTVTGVITFGALTAADAVTATFEFDVPVRFAQDDLRLALHLADVGEVPQIPLVELKLDSDGDG